MSVDLLEPIALVLPNTAGSVKANTGKLGDIQMSGGKIVFNTGSKWEVVTSATI